MLKALLVYSELQKLFIMTITTSRLNVVRKGDLKYIFYQQAIHIQAI